MVEHWVTAAQIFDGTTLHGHSALRMIAGNVADLVPISELPKNALCIPINGTLTPGFVDLQVNGGGGVLFNHSPDIGAIAHIAKAHHMLGTCAIMPTVITDTPQVLEAAARAALAAKDLPQCAGLHIEGPHIDPRKCGTHDERFIRPLDQTTIQIIQTLRNNAVTVMITLAPEAASTAQIQQLCAMGAIVSLGHSACDAEQANIAFAAGANCATHLFNAMSGMTGRAAGLAGAAINSDAYAGIICDGVHVSDDMIGLALRARPVCDRMFLVSDAMPTVGGPDHFTLYGQDIHLRNGKLINARGDLAGAHVTIAQGVKRLVSCIGQPLQTALRMGITVPATLINAPHLHQIIGRRAVDIMVMDTDLTITGSLQSVIDNQHG